MSKQITKVPAIRFKGFTDPWEQRKLSDVKDVRDGTHDSPKYHEHGHPLVTSKNLKENGLDMSNVSLISDKDFEVINQRSNVNIGDILFGMIGTIGNPVIINRDDFAIKNVALLKKGGEVSNEFLLQLLKSRIFDNYIRVENAGGTQKFLGLSQIRDFKFLAPSVNEEAIIGSFFSALDNLITLQQRELDLMKKQKQTLLSKMFPKIGERFPEIRFKGFTDSWEQCEFNNVFTYLQNNSLSRADLNYEHGSIKNIHYGDVLIKFGEIIDVEKSTIPFITDSDFVLGNLAALDNGDIIIADAAEDETVGKCTEITGLNDVVVVSGLHTIPCRPSNKYASGFMGYYMNSNAYHNQLLPLIQGTKISSISKRALKETKIIFPVSHKEQDHIGSFFNQLDNLITLQQRKLDQMKIMKKSLLKAMFV